MRRIYLLLWSFLFLTSIDPQISVDPEQICQNNKQRTPSEQRPWKFSAYFIVHTFKLFTFLGPTNFLKKYFAQINKRGLTNKNIKLGNPPKFNKHRPTLIRNFSVRYIDSLSENTFFEKF